MIAKHRSLTLFASLSLVSVPLASFGQEAPEDTKALFNEVNQHLDLGGQFYGFLNVKGDFTSLGVKAQEIYEQLAEMSNGEMPAGLNITGFLQNLGLENLDALGISSIKYGDGFRNRMVAAVDGPRQGILKLSGGPARPFEIGSVAPASALIAMEWDIDLNGLQEVAVGIGAELEKSMGMDPVSDALKQPIPGTALTIEQLLASLKGTLFAYALTDKTKTLEIPESPRPIPGIDFVIAHKTGKPLFAQIKSFLESNAPAEAFREETNGDRTTLQILIPEGDNLGFYAPLVQISEGSDQLVFASRPEALTSLTEGERLSSNTDFARVSGLLPKTGNSYSYVSKEAYDYLDLVTEIMSAASPEMGSIQKKTMDLIYGKPQPMAGAMANTDKGILIDSFAPMSYKLSLAYGAIVPVAVTASAIIPMMNRMQQR